MSAINRKIALTARPVGRRGHQNSRLPDPGRENRKATGLSSFSAAAPTVFFVYGFPKSPRANIDHDEKKQFKETAKHVLALTGRQIAELLEKGDFEEVRANEQKVSK